MEIYGNPGAKSYFHIFPVFSWINPFTKHLEQDAGVMSVPDPA